MKILTNEGLQYFYNQIAAKFSTKEQTAEAIEEAVGNAGVGVVTSVNGKTGVVQLSASDVGALPASTQIPSIAGLATETYVDNKVAAMVDSAPETLNTLNELAAALGDDPNFATTVATEIGGKVSKSGDTMTGNLTIDKSSKAETASYTVANSLSNISLIAFSDGLHGIWDNKKNAMALWANTDNNWVLEGTASGNVNKSGDTMTGNLTIKKSTYPTIRLTENDTNKALNLQFASGIFDVSTFNAGDSADNYRTLRLVDSEYRSSVAHALSILDVVNGTRNTYNIYHEGNKPTAADVGALPISGGTLTGSLTMGDGTLFIAGHMHIGSNTGPYLYTGGTNLVVRYGDSSNYHYANFTAGGPIEVDGNAVSMSGHTHNGSEILGQVASAATAAIVASEDMKVSLSAIDGHTGILAHKSDKADFLLYHWDEVDIPALAVHYYNSNGEWIANNVLLNHENFYNWVTPAAIGAVSKTGDTMTGQLTASGLSIKSDGWAMLRFYNTEGAEIGGFYSNQDARQLNFFSKDKSGYNDYFKLPYPSGLTADGYYDILTSKNPVTIAQGGTGATTAQDAAHSLIRGNAIAPSNIEFWPPSNAATHGGYLDFHFNQASDDYTSRIIESAKGELSINILGDVRVGNITYGNWKGSTIPVAYGGTGAMDAATARTNLGITPANIGAAPASHTHHHLIAAHGNAGELFWHDDFLLSSATRTVPSLHFGMELLYRHDSSTSQYYSIYDTGNKPTAADVGAIPTAIAIATSTDLNNITTPGFYHCAANATVATLANTPTGNAFYMEVGKHAGVYQRIVEYTTAGTAKIYIRNYYAGTWSAWGREYTTWDKPTTSEIGALPVDGKAVAANYADHATTSNWLVHHSSSDFAPTFGANGLQYFNASLPNSGSASTSYAPTTDWWHILRMNHSNASGYYVDIGTCFHEDRIALRRVVSGTDCGWVDILTAKGGSITGNLSVSGTITANKVVGAVYA